MFCQKAYSLQALTLIVVEIKAYQSFTIRNKHWNSCISPILSIYIEIAELIIPPSESTDALSFLECLNPKTIYIQTYWAHWSAVLPLIYLCSKVCNTIRYYLNIQKSLIQSWRILGFIVVNAQSLVNWF